MNDKNEKARSRRFNDACGLAHALDLVGHRWALLIVRELMLGPRRFSDLRDDLPGISANMLTQRLNELEENHIVERFRLPPPANVPVYGLTDWGHDARPMILEMARWAFRSPSHERTLPLTTTSILLSLMTNLDRARVGDLALRIGFTIGGRSYSGKLDASGLAVLAQPARRPDIAYTGTARGLAARLYANVALEALEQDSLLQATGDLALEARFALLFALPERYRPTPRQDSPGNA